MGWFLLHEVDVMVQAVVQADGGWHEAVKEVAAAEPQNHSGGRSCSGELPIYNELQEQGLTRHGSAAGTIAAFAM
jgi:hypothetical protein